ncbi:unnamed protein product [Blepharisma stoltei]|uniref:Uncharacterized protein n=1 Tax=Blepharisma stoltei TaxID=1481888 RepID=A0AAU9JCB0_9CILI|nr:unnamed protein product [Blepharisma stoltei]
MLHFALFPPSLHLSFKFLTVYFFLDSVVSHPFELYLFQPPQSFDLIDSYFGYCFTIFSMLSSEIESGSYPVYKSNSSLLLLNLANFDALDANVLIQWTNKWNINYCISKYQRNVFLLRFYGVVVARRTLNPEIWVQFSVEPFLS